MSNKFRFWNLLAIIYVLAELTLLPQITSSPYSIFGLGSTEGAGSGTGNALGNTGIALLNGQTINLLNPASAGGMDSLVSVFEIGFAGKYTIFTTSEKSQSLFDANFRYMSLAFRVTPRWALTAGITPYSTIGYNINVESDIEGTTQQYSKTFTGEGGVNRVYLGNSIRITKNLFFGINAVYLFGTVSQTESSDDYRYTLQEKTYISNFNLDYGLIYRFRLNSWNYNLGIIYDNGKTLSTDKESTIITASSVETTKNSVKEYKVPESFGIGFGFEKGHFRGGLDFETKRWSEIEFTNPLLKSRNSNRYSLGLEIPSWNRGSGYSKMVLYRMGAQYCESYMVIDGHPINYRSVSFGAGFPFKGFSSVINLSVELGQNGTAKGGLFRESFCTLHIDISLKDLWFVKRKYM